MEGKEIFYIDVHYYFFAHMRLRIADDGALQCKAMNSRVNRYLIQDIFQYPVLHLL